MKEILYSHSIVANPAVWILLAIVIMFLMISHLQVVKSLKFEDLREKAKYLLKELVIIDLVIAAVVTIAVCMHYQLMKIDRSMFRIDRDLTTVTLESNTPILIGGQFDIVKDDGNVIVVKSRRQKKDYRIEKFYLPKKEAND